MRHAVYSGYENCEPVDLRLPGWASCRMWTERTTGASGYPKAQESGAESARARPSRVSSAGTGRHARACGNEQPIGRDAKALIGDFR